MSTDPILVIGAGPAGMLAALGASRSGAAVVLCEQQAQAGRKLCATGNGRANVTHVMPRKEFLECYGSQWRFIRLAFDALNPEALRRFLADAGVPTKAETDGRVFPVSDSALDVRRALLQRCQAQGVELRLRTRVNDLRITDGRIAGVDTDHGTLATTHVILAAGSRADTALGASELGYHLARQARHTVTALQPALVPLRLQEAWLRPCAGVVLEDAVVRLQARHAAKKSWRGRVLITHRGLSGPAVLDASGHAAACLAERSPLPIVLQPCADMERQAWEKLFASWRRKHGQKQVGNLLDRKLPRSFGIAICTAAGDVAKVRMAELSRAQARALLDLLIGMPLMVTGTEGFSKAMVTRGGVALPEVDPRTLASRSLAGLYLAGEVLDVDGPTGGFNLQWAFASGWLAGGAAGRDWLQRSGADPDRSQASPICH